MQKINFLDLELQQNKIKSILDTNLKKVLNHSNYIMGPEVKQLEKALEVYTGAKYCITCASGTDALILSLLAYGIGKGHFVICPSFTFPATAEAILITGATPIFIDVGKKTFNLCYRQLEKTLENNKNKLDIKAVIAVDLFGLPANYNKLKAISKKYNIKIIADAAQSFGASVNEKKVGNLASLTCTSFFPAKPLGCYGDGGAIFTNNKILKDKLVSLRAHGKSTSKYKISKIGLNSRLDTIQAAILLAKMKIFDWELVQRDRNAKLFNFELEKLYKVPKLPKGTSSAWAQYTIIVEKRNKLMNYLKGKKIPFMVYYPVPMHRQPAYKAYADKNIELKRSKELSRTVISLPVHAYLKETEKEYILYHLKRAKNIL
tara:strand:- start:1766 stop:2890 length:1125 start_codon:yes stop_codon:yes gene_type:complete